MSTHLVPGGAAVTIAHDGSSIPNSPSANSYAIYSPGFTGASSPTYSGSIPSVGSPITLGHFTLSNTGSVETVGSQTFALLALAADSTTANAAGYSLGVGPNTGAGYRAGAFDVGDTTAPVRNTLSFSGATVTLTWTEAGSPPVVQSAGLTSIIVSGNATYNGTYTQVSGANSVYNGAPQYTNGTYFILWNGTKWLLGGTVNQPASAFFLSSATGASAYNIPLASWTTIGPTPVPTFATTPTGNTSPGYGTNQGLTITGLSGGAVTISAVSTSGTTTTFTTSRAIGSGETGGTLAGVAGAFSDSAATPNLTAAFSIPITSAMFGSGGSGPVGARVPKAVYL